MQIDGGLPAPWKSGKNTFVPLARFAVKAVVLSTHRYHWDRGAEIAPVDLALGWGRMSEAEVINRLQISQDGRWFEYRWKGAPPLPPEEIVRSASNMHLIPQGPEERAALLAVRRHELVAFSGYLVEVQGEDGGRWRSSLSREDSGGHACEVVWLQKIATRPL